MDGSSIDHRPRLTRRSALELAAVALIVPRSSAFAQTSSSFIKTQIAVAARVGYAISKMLASLSRSRRPRIFNRSRTC
jgi:hypothetical protein